VQQLLVLVFIFNIGDVAVGSMKGEIRLYNKVGKQAKTLIPALGDPKLKNRNLTKAFWNNIRSLQ